MRALSCSTVASSPAAAAGSGGRGGRRDAAELLVVDQLGDGGVVAADRTVRVLAELQLAETHPQRVVDQKAADERLADPHDQLDRLGGLDGAYHAGQDPEHAALGAARHEAGRRRLGVQAAVARAVLGAEDRGLPLEAEDAAVGVRYAEDHAGVVDQIAGRKVVSAVDDDVVAAQHVERVGGRERHLVALDVDLGVDGVEAVTRRLQLRPPDVRRAVDDLPLQVAVVDHVEVDDAEPADAGPRPGTSRPASRAPRRRCTGRWPPSASTARPCRPPA